jgi:hypothetical protein
VTPRFRARVALVAPIALVATGCDPVVYSPADYTTYTPTPILGVHAPAQRDLMAAWQLPPASPWMPYEKLTLFAALDEAASDWPLPDLEALPSVRRARAAGTKMALLGVPEDAAVFVDLAGAASVAFAEAYNRSAPVRFAAVPTFNNWPDDDELVPAEETLAGAILLTPSQPLDPSARPMFLLDAWRLAYKEIEVDDDVVDNRYALTASDLPRAEALATQGVHRVLYIVEGSAAVSREEDDLHEVFDEYASYGIEVDLVGLDDLLGEPAPTAYGGTRSAVQVYVGGGLWWRRVPLRIAPRRLVVYDPYFHQRSRGGWGGLQAVPMSGRLHFSHGGG